MRGIGKKTAHRPKSKYEWFVFLSRCIIMEKALDLGPESAISWLCNLGQDQPASLFLNFLIFKIGDEAFIISHNWNENEIKQLNEDDDVIKANISLALGIVCKHLVASYFCSKSASSESEAKLTSSEVCAPDSAETDRPTTLRCPAGSCPIISFRIHRNIYQMKLRP